MDKSRVKKSEPPKFLNIVLQDLGGDSNTTYTLEVEINYTSNSANKSSLAEAENLEQEKLEEDLITEQK